MPAALRLAHELAKKSPLALAYAKEATNLYLTGEASAHMETSSASSRCSSPRGPKRAWQLRREARPEFRGARAANPLLAWEEAHVRHLTIAGREFGSRLLLGTGKYDTFETMRDAVAASGAEIVTVAVRRIDFDAPGEDITSFLPEEVLLLPNTSGCETADEAVRSASSHGPAASGLGQARGHPRPALPPARSGRDAARRPTSSRRASRSSPTSSRPRAGQEARGGRLRDGDAARRADRAAVA